MTKPAALSLVVCLGVGVLYARRAVRQRVADTERATLVSDGGREQLGTRPKPARSVRDLVRELQASGTSISQIAAALGRSPHVIRKIVAGESNGEPYRVGIIKMRDSLGTCDVDGVGLVDDQRVTTTL